MKLVNVHKLSIEVYDLTILTKLRFETAGNRSWYRYIPSSCMFVRSNMELLTWFHRLAPPDRNFEPTDLWWTSLRACEYRRSLSRWTAQAWSWITSSVSTQPDRFRCSEPKFQSQSRAWSANCLLPSVVAMLLTQFFCSDWQPSPWSDGPSIDSPWGFSFLTRVLPEPIMARTEFRWPVLSWTSSGLDVHRAVGLVAGFHADWSDKVAIIRQRDRHNSTRNRRTRESAASYSW